jgi:hypothetical protein
MSPVSMPRKDTNKGREQVEDLQALIAPAGGEAYGYAISSVAALALATAAAGPGITKLAL